ncbi:MAG: WecB/TagA/CpsF family glycosyltransferase [Muribaculaceae bacterium]|mgnify:CR=1 FL=1|jgi:UDP-N-acetyl-D-mannosaminouronate:lipid I N-acetyl-D-mannosaminouronosyltransferase|nr:WecB/TagA/CpsF family glycosyltransferase [Muribaculaceae bacterium]
MEKSCLRGVDVYPFRSADEIIDFADRRKGILVAINAEKVMFATDDTRRIINNNIGYCDGSGPVLALRQKGFKDVCKVAGCDLWLNIVDRFHSVKSFYIVGASEDVNACVVEKLRTEYPGIRIAGRRNGFFSDDKEREALISDIAETKPDVVFVAMGSPRQELFMAEMQMKHPDAIYQGLGGSFDVYVGRHKRAGKWWSDHHLESLFQIIHEPKRIKRKIKYWRFAWWLVARKF